MQQKHWFTSLAAGTLIVLSAPSFAQEQGSAKLLEQAIDKLRELRDRALAPTTTLPQSSTAAISAEPLAADLLGQSVNYCERVNNSEYVKHYVRIAKEFHENNALQQVSVLDQYFDNSDRVLSQWLQRRLNTAAKQVGGPNADAFVIETIKTTIDQCAYEVKDN